MREGSSQVGISKDVFETSIFRNTDIRIPVNSSNNAHCQISFMERNFSIEIKAWSFALQRIMFL